MPVICVLVVACCVLMCFAGVRAGQNGEGVKLCKIFKRMFGTTVDNNH